MPDSIVLALGPCAIERGGREWAGRINAWMTPRGALQVTLEVEGSSDDIIVSVPAYAVPDQPLKKRAARLVAA